MIMMKISINRSNDDDGNRISDDNDAASVVVVLLMNWLLLNWVGELNLLSEYWWKDSVELSLNSAYNQLTSIQYSFIISIQY